jgi:methyltransferase (TIGR00027 family)
MANPVSQTAWYCCGVRAQDAERSHPVLDDRYAARFMSEEGKRVFARFADLKFPNRSNVVRHLIVDDMLRDALARDKNQFVLLLGCGFDARAYRLGGGRWLEVDEAPLIEFKNECLPISECQAPLTRVSIDFARQTLAEVLAPWKGEREPVIVIEGVLMYLDRPRIDALLATLESLWPRHRLIVDLMNDTFRKRYAGPILAGLKQLGTTFTWTVRDPQEPFRLAGYRELRRESQVERAALIGSRKIPWILRRTFLRSLIQGYTVREFEFGAGS